MATQAPANVPKPVVAKPTGQVRVTRTTVRGLSVRQWVLTTIVGTRKRKTKLTESADCD